MCWWWDLSLYQSLLNQSMHGKLLSINNLWLSFLSSSTLSIDLLSCILIGSMVSRLPVSRGHPTLASLLSGNYRQIVCFIGRFVSRVMKLFTSVQRLLSDPANLLANSSMARIRAQKWKEYSSIVYCNAVSLAILHLHASHTHNSVINPKKTEFPINPFSWLDDVVLWESRNTNRENYWNRFCTI